MESVWDAAARQGWLGLGADDALHAAVVVMRELGRAACPLPAMDAFVAGRLLASRVDAAAAIANGALRAVVGPEQGAGDIHHVEAAAYATHVLLVAPGGGEVSLRPIVSFVETPGLARPAWSTVVTGPPAEVQTISEDAAEEAFALLRLGLAVRAMGAAEHAHELALEHAKVRRQFGSPIGSFQAVQHRVATCEIDVRAGRLLADEAIRLHGSFHGSWLLASELTVAHATAAAPRVQLDAHHTLAAIGYFEEHEAPWLFRRVHADVARIALFALRRGEPADMLVESPSSLPPFDLGETAEAFRAELREFFAAHGAGDQRLDVLEDDEALAEAMCERRYFGIAWPPEYGGRAADVPEQVVFSEECGYHEARVGQLLATVGMISQGIVRHGTDDQRRTFLPMIGRGELRMCLGYSEPEAGSDLAALRTRAHRDGDEWVINGQKLWGTGAHTANYVWLAARTDPAATPPHAGITVFLFPMNTPGITVQQHRALSGEISCTVFYDDVRVPDSARIGDVNGGWKVITDALAAERVQMGGHTARVLRQLDELLTIVRQNPEAIVGERGSAKRRRITELAVQVQASRALVKAAVQATSAGDGARLEAPMAKIATGEVAEAFGEAALEILGPTGALSSGGPGGDRFEKGLRLSIMYVVAGGTNDIQRSLVARGLGLPRSTPRSGGG